MWLIVVGDGVVQDGLGMLLECNLLFSKAPYLSISSYNLGQLDQLAARTCVAAYALTE